MFMSLFVHAEYHSRGIGLTEKRMLNRVTVDVNEQNELGLGFYQR